MNVRELLVEPTGFLVPASVLDGLSADDAERPASATMHSVAAVVAHMTFWQEWFVERCHGRGGPPAASAAMGWPTVAPGTWSEVHDRFLRGLDAAVAVGADASRLDARVHPPIEFPSMADLTIHAALIHIAMHNAHHLGQVITLRQVMGLWPPPGGGYTW